MASCPEHWVFLQLQEQTSLLSFPWPSCSSPTWPQTFLPPWSCDKLMFKIFHKMSCFFFFFHLTDEDLSG